MKTTHTPVQFSVTAIEDDDICDARLVVNTNIYAGDKDAAERLATTIEAAPDLLAALEALVLAVDPPVGRSKKVPVEPYFAEPLAAARAAIAKARGKGVGNG